MCGALDGCGGSCSRSVRGRSHLCARPPFALKKRNTSTHTIKTTTMKVMANNTILLIHVQSIVLQTELRCTIMQCSTMVSFQYYPGTFLAFPGTHRVTVDICHCPQYMCNDMSLDFLLGGFGTRLIRATDILQEGRE